MRGTYRSLRHQLFATTLITSLVSLAGALLAAMIAHALGSGVGSVYVRVASDLRDRAASYGGIALLTAAVAALAAWLASGRLSRIFTRPMLAIAASAREMAKGGDYSRGFERSTGDEWAEMASAFDGVVRGMEGRTRALEAANRILLQLKLESEQRVRDHTADFERSMRELALAVAGAQQATRAKSEYLCDVVHELRTPLNAIVGFGQLLTIDGPGSLTPESRTSFVAQIVKAGEHMLALVDRILDQEQVDACGTALSIESLALADLLEECRAMMEPCAAQRDVRLQFGPISPRLIQADRIRLRQVLLNLLSNAVKYNRDGGSVVVDCPPQPEGWVRIEVRDTGFGLTPGQLQALFQPFNRLGQEAGSQRGTGIGLVVTKRLVELMGGRIGVSSEPGVGTRFWIELEASVTPATPRKLSVDPTQVC